MANKGEQIDFRHLFNNIPGRYIVLLPDLTVAAVSDEYLKATMVEREMLVGQKLFDVFPENPADEKAHGAANVRASLEKVFQTGKPDLMPVIKYDIQNSTADGNAFEERFWRLATYPFFDDAKNVVCVIHHIDDITEQENLKKKEAEIEKINSQLKTHSRQIESERNSAEAALVDARLRLEAALDAGEIGTWTFDVLNNKVAADKNLAKFFAFDENSGAEGELEKFTASIHPEDRARVVEEINDALENGETIETEYRIVGKDKAIRWVMAKGRVLRGADGKPYQLPGVIFDITDRKLTEEKLRKSDERLNLVTRATNDAIWDWNLQTNDVWWNKAVQTMFDYKENEVEPDSKWWYEHIHPEDRERVVKGIHDVIDNGGENWTDEYRYLCSDGNFKYVFDRGFAIHKDGKPLRMLGAMQDVTARKDAETALKKSQERLQLVLDSSVLGLWYCDLPFDVLSWSDRTKSHFWLSPEATVTIEDFYRIIHPEDRENTRQAIDKSIQERTDYDVEYRTVDGETGRIKWIRALGRGFYDENDNPYRFDGITIDISDEKLIQVEREQLLWSEKNARAEAENANRLKDEFLATLSHELRTPLSSILGWSRMLREMNLPESQREKAIETIERNAKSQAQLIEDILDVSRITSGKLRLNVQPIEVAPIIELVLESVRPAAAAKGIRLQKVLDSDGMISGDADRLQQIIWNLMSNAIKFTPKGGKVAIKLERIDSHVEVTVTDNGQGIEAEALPFIFERFRQSDSSTTRVHGGLGLGLAIVRHLVELHGGTVQAHSEGKDCGAVFSLNFPIIPLRSDKDQFFENVQKSVLGSEQKNLASITCPPEIKGLRVLLVDDEPDTLEILMFVFSSCEAKVKGVSSVDAALEILAQEEFDVLVSDIGMPYKDGFDLIKTLRKLPAEKGGRIPAVALTAYARFEDRMKVLSAGFQMHIPKPVEPAELLTVVANLANWHDKS
ncbi:MAG TPA: PAS domain-containing protein [Pyrinomonadaceae bacterium]|nr:PAS domain-containing protein [Pyrinomonadaceae bacterium]